MTDRAALRQRLLEMRSRLLNDLDRHIDGGVLALLAGVNAALLALDVVREEAAPAERAVVADDGRETWLTLYAGSTTAAAVKLDPAQAVRLAGQLIAVAVARLR